MNRWTKFLAWRHWVSTCAVAKTVPRYPQFCLENHVNHPLLQVSGLKKSYGPAEVLKGISFNLQKGETLSLIGPSGSGKSTCLRCLNFLEKPQAGEVLLESERIGQVPAGKDAWRFMTDTEMAPPRVRSSSLSSASVSRSRRIVILETPNSAASSSADTDLRW